MEDQDRSEPAEAAAGGDGEEALSADAPAGVDVQAALAEALTAALSRRLQAAAVHPGGARAGTYGQFRGGIREQSCCFRLTDDTGAAGCAEITAPIAFPLLGKLLGGGESEACVPDRPLTRIERRVLGKVADWVADAAAGMLPDGPRLRRAPEEDGPDDLPADQDVVVLAFTVELHHQVGTLRLCLPRELAPADLATPGRIHPTGRYVPADGAHAASSAPLELSVTVEDCAIAAADLADLARGDILVTDADAGGEVIVRVAGIPKYAGQLGAADGQRAVKITRRLNDGSPAGPATDRVDLGGAESIDKG